jgi:predicted HicB family RNase H-like nuclease
METKKGTCTGSEEDDRKCMEYKGYRGSVEYDEKNNEYFGEVKGIISELLYKGKDEEELRNNFEDVIDEYLEMHRKHGSLPETLKYNNEE